MGGIKGKTAWIIVFITSSFASVALKLSTGRMLMCVGMEISQLVNQCKLVVQKSNEQNLKSASAS